MRMFICYTILVTKLRGVVPVVSVSRNKSIELHILNQG